MAGKQQYTAMRKEDNDQHDGVDKRNKTEENAEKYGCFSCYPSSLTFLASAWFFLLFMCMLIFSDAFNIGTLSGALTSLETRYDLKASELGLIESLYEAGNLIFVIFVVHFAGRQEHRRPLWIGLGSLTMAIGTAIAMSPQFIFPAYNPDWRLASTNQTSEPLTCLSDWMTGSATDQCEGGDQLELRRGNRAAYGIVLFGEILVGIGWTPVMPLAMSYIDDNVSTKTSAMFIGIIQSMFGVGTIFGFLASAAVASKWVDFYRVNSDEIKITPDDNLWVGAWWLGLAITSSLYLISSLPFLGFPRRLPSRPSKDKKAENFMSAKSAAVENDTEEGLVNTTGPTSKHALSVIALPTAIWRMVRNPIFVWINVSAVSEMAVIAGLVTFLPKYLETQFGLSPPQANFFMAVIPVPAVAFGSVIGGYLVKKLNLKAGGAIKLALACSVIALVGEIALLGVGCNGAGIAGVDAPYLDDNRTELEFHTVNLTSSCNADCVCGSEPQLVCGVDGISYFSPCQAGCKESINGTFFDCSCVQVLTNQSGSMAGSVQHGACPMSNCNTLAAFLALIFIIALVSSCEEVPQLMIIMRCVDKNDKSLALGLKHVFIRIFGNIPAPLYYGAAIDATCLLWDMFCGERTECWAYSLNGFRYAFIGITVGLRVISSLSYLMTWMLLRRKAGKASGSSRGNYDRADMNGKAVPGTVGSEVSGEAEPLEAVAVERESSI